MKKLLFISLLLIPTVYLIAQTGDSITKNDIERLKIQIGEINAKLDSAENEHLRTLEDFNLLKKSNLNLNQDYNRLSQDFSTSKLSLEEKIDSLENIIGNNKANIEKTGSELVTKIDNAEKSASDGMLKLQETISHNTIYWIIAVIIVTVLLILVFITLRKLVFKNSADLAVKIRDTRRNLEEESIKLDKKLIEVLDKQLNLSESISQISGNKTESTDHTLALKVADEIIRIGKNLDRMDENTKGVKQLAASVRRIQDNFASNGYELIEMLGKPYNEGMRVTANFIPDDTLKNGEQIITRIIKPQVNYKGVMIQSAQIEVSQGE